MNEGGSRLLVPRPGVLGGIKPHGILPILPSRIERAAIVIMAELVGRGYKDHYLEKNVIAEKAVHYAIALDKALTELVDNPPKKEGSNAGPGPTPNCI